MKQPSFLLLALAGAVPLLAQTTVDQVLEKYTQAIGGQAAVEKVTSRTWKGTVEIPDDNVTGTVQMVAKAPDRFHMMMDIPGYGVVETVLDGQNGWEKNPDSGVHAMSNQDLAVARREHLFYRELKIKEMFPKLTMLEDGKVNGRPVHVIEAAPESGTAEKLYFDTESGLLLKRDYERITLEDGIVQYEMVLSDYRDVDGLKIPTTIEQRSPDSTTIFKYSEIKNDSPVEDNAFAKPVK
ncbi:MAG: hypothetical protein U0Q18_10310 [Bryobacteraceae bacterium]